MYKDKKLEMKTVMPVDDVFSKPTTRSKQPSNDRTDKIIGPLIVCSNTSDLQRETILSSWM